MYYICGKPRSPAPFFRSRKGRSLIWGDRGASARFVGKGVHEVAPGAPEHLEVAPGDDELARMERRPPPKNSPNRRHEVFDRLPRDDRPAFRGALGERPGRLAHDGGSVARQGLQQGKAKPLAP